MKPAFALAAALVIGVASSAAATAQQIARAAPPPTNAAAVSTLASQIRGAVATARSGAVAQGLTGQPFELSVSSAVETIIATSGQEPASVLAAVQLAMAEEKCVETQPAGFAPGGCQALADIEAAVSAAIGGPAALGGTGAVASSAGGGPPRTSAGSDYGS